MSKVRALIFDMDGVIVDSNPVHRESWEVYNRRHGVETTEAMHRRMYGQRNDQIIREFLGADLSDEEVRGHGRAKEALYRELMAPKLKDALVPGVTEFLERYRELPKAVATNANRVNLEFVVVEAGLGPAFRVMLDGNQISNPKPDPEIYLKAAEMLGVAPAECVVFEDSHPGVEAGVAAGMRVIGLATTHEVLPGVEFTVRDFLDRRLEEWMLERM